MYNTNRDITSQILKNYPFYPRISKQHYLPELYYNEYCQLDISFNEFLNYITENDVGFTFMIMVDGRRAVNYIIYHIVKFKFNNDYGINRIDFINNEIETYKSLSYNKRQMLELVINKHNISDVLKVIYDINTVKSIYYRRVQCQHYNKFYDKEMSQLYLNQLQLDISIQFINYEDYIKYFAYYIFLLFNLEQYKLIDNKYINYK